MVRYLTEQDVLDAASRGRQIVLKSDERLTPLAQDAVRQLGLAIVRAEDAARESDAATEPDLHAIIRAAVLARLGSEPEDLDAIIAGILDGLEGLG